MEPILEVVQQLYGADALQEAWSEWVLWDEDAPSLHLRTPHQQLFVRACQEFCVTDPRGKRSSNMMVNRFRASGQLRIGMVQRWAAR